MVCGCFCKSKKQKKSQIPAQEITQTSSKRNVNPCGNETLHESTRISDQNSQNELIEVSEIKPCNRNLENNEKHFEEIEINLKECLDSHENKPDENHELNDDSEIKPCKRNLEYNEKPFEGIEINLKEFSDSHENKSDENHSAQDASNYTKLKIHKKREKFFESFHETEPKINRKSKISENNNSSVEKKEKDEIAKEILNAVLPEKSLEVDVMEIHNDFIKEFVNVILSNAIHIVSVVKIVMEELLNELLIEILPGIWQSVIWKPLGFANPRGYCYLNSVVQVLGSCEDFKKDIYNYNWNTTEKTNDSIFVEGLFNLIRAQRKHNKERIDKSLNIVQKNITESSCGDDVYKCFMNLLTRVSNVIKTNTDGLPDHFSSLPITLSEKAKSTFTRFKNRNPGFVFENFYGQLTFQTVCKKCNTVCNESFQMIKSLPLPVPKSNSFETLNSCIDMFFNESDVEVDEPMRCKCEGGSSMSLKSITKLTCGPKYLFIYLNRGSYTDDGDKNNTYVTCDDLTIYIKTLEDKSIKYKLISVIDHIGDSAYGHYYCKCSFETEKWWLLNDYQVERLKNKNNIVTDKAIVFFFKKTL